jgi:hypothetical protein
MRGMPGAASRHTFPATDIEQLLTEIERGYAGRPSR